MPSPPTPTTTIPVDDVLRMIALQRARHPPGGTMARLADRAQLVYELGRDVLGVTTLELPVHVSLDAAAPHVFYDDRQLWAAVDALDLRRLDEPAPERAGGMASFIQLRAWCAYQLGDEGPFLREYLREADEHYRAVTSDRWASPGAAPASRAW